MIKNNISVWWLSVSLSCCRQLYLNRSLMLIEMANKVQYKQNVKKFARASGIIELQHNLHPRHGYV